MLPDFTGDPPEMKTTRFYWIGALLGCSGHWGGGTIGCRIRGGVNGLGGLDVVWVTDIAFPRGTLPGHNNWDRRYPNHNQ